MTAPVTVFGAGYVGLVTGVCLASSGHEVTVLDVDRDKVSGLASGHVPIHEPGLEDLLAKGLEQGNLRFRALDERQGLAPFVFVAVGTPPTSAGAADLSFVRDVVDLVAGEAGPGTLVVMKSTVPPGTGARFAGQLSACGALYASNPEFLREGSAVRDWFETDRIVIGGADEAVSLLASLYSDIDAPVVATDIGSAEMIKYASNAFLATKISFINEIATLCDLTGADVDQVARGVGMDGRIGEAFLRPGIGYGGSCFPKDTRALDFLAHLHGYDFHLLRAVIDVNARQRLLPVRALRAKIDCLEGVRVTVLGLTFKPDTDDVREAPAADICEMLVAEGALVTAYDPMAGTTPAGVTRAASLAEAVESAQAVVLATEWAEFTEADWAALAATMSGPRLVFDGRNALDPASVRAGGGDYLGVGRPTA